jgi:UDP-glucose 4-epimerase
MQCSCATPEHFHEPIVVAVLDRQVPVRDAPRRSGGAMGGLANVGQARMILKWSTQLSLEDGVRSAL